MPGGRAWVGLELMTGPHLCKVYKHLHHENQVTSVILKEILHNLLFNYLVTRDHPWLITNWKHYCNSAVLNWLPSEDWLKPCGTFHSWIKFKYHWYPLECCTLGLCAASPFLTPWLVSNCFTSGCKQEILLQARPWIITDCLDNNRLQLL